MDEKKVKGTKKTLNIKNKKAATKTLAKSSIKGKTTPKNKKTSIKKTKLPKEKVNKIKELENKEIILEPELKKKQENNVPNNIKRKLPKEKDIKKKDKKKEKVEKDKLPKEKSKIKLPKEWQIINEKNKSENKKNNKSKSLDQTQGIKNKLKSSIFEEVEEQTLIERKKKSKQKLKKNLIILLIVISIVSVAAISLLKYNDFVKRSLAIYDVYRIGDKVKLDNGTVWYVVKDSDSKESKIILLSNDLIDVNNDQSITELDKIQFNKGNTIDYDDNNEDSVAYYLNKTYKKILEESIGSIDNVRLLTSKEYVKIRERMGYGYEWNESNFLANNNFSRWWLNSTQNDKVYVVTPKGTYTLVSPNAFNYIRPTIEISKEKVTRVEEQRKMRVDLATGLSN